METPTVQQDMPAWPLPEPEPARGRLARWLPLLLAVMVGCGAVAAFAAPSNDSFLTRDASLSVFFADVDRGLVHEVYDGTNSVVWRPDGDWTWSAAPTRGFGENGRHIDGIRGVMAEAAKVNSDADLTVVHQQEGWSALSTLGIFGGFGAFLLLIGGPAPRRANRWAWFWLFYVGRTSGLGILAFLLLGAWPARRRTEPGQHRAAPRDRADGWQGFAIALVAGLTVSVLGASLQGYVVPDRSGLANYTYDQSTGPR